MEWKQTDFCFQSGVYKAKANVRRGILLNTLKRLYSRSVESSKVWITDADTGLS